MQRTSLLCLILCAVISQAQVERISDRSSRPKATLEIEPGTNIGRIRFSETNNDSGRNEQEKEDAKAKRIAARKRRVKAEERAKRINAIRKKKREVKERRQEVAEVEREHEAEEAEEEKKRQKREQRINALLERKNDERQKEREEEKRRKAEEEQKRLEEEEQKRLADEEQKQESKETDNTSGVVSTLTTKVEVLPLPVTTDTPETPEESDESSSEISVRFRGTPSNAATAEEAESSEEGSDKTTPVLLFIVGAGCACAVVVVLRKRRMSEREGEDWEDIEEDIDEEDLDSVESHQTQGGRDLYYEVESSRGSEDITEIRPSHSASAVYEKMLSRKMSLSMLDVEI